MKTNIFRYFFLLSFVFAATLTANAQSTCVPTAYLQRNAAQVFLIQLTQIGHVPVEAEEYKGARVDTRGAHLKVLKVYFGDIATLKDIENAMLEIHCNNEGGLSCRILEEQNYPFQVGDMYIVYDAPNEDGLLTLKITSCPSSWRLIDDEETLVDFERLYPPQWLYEDDPISSIDHFAPQQVEDGNNEEQEELILPAPILP